MEIDALKEKFLLVERERSELDGKTRAVKYDDFDTKRLVQNLNFRISENERNIKNKDSEIERFKEKFLLVDKERSEQEEKLKANLMK